jgi:tetratricopeptide (TPR) repeat protein
MAGVKEAKGSKPAKGSKDLQELSAGELEVLEEERAFLLRSLRDLDAEHEAGDVDQHDYDSLRDDYTARAARVIRTIERHQARRAVEEPRASRWRRVGVAAGVVLFALLAGVIVAQATGRRQAGETATGSIRETSRQQIDRAIQTAATGDYDAAVAMLDDIVAVAPDNVEALTYKGWFQYRAGDGGDGVDSLTAAVQADPTFPATHAFLAVILAQNGRPDLAREELDRLDALDPPAVILQLVEPLRQELEARPAESPTGPPAG